MFEDTAELEHVFGLVENYADLARLTLSDAQLELVRARGPLPALERRCVDRLKSLGIMNIAEAANTLQEAYVAILQALAAAPLPRDWSGKRLARFHTLLLTAHALEGDAARAELRPRIVKMSSSVIDDLLQRFPESQAKQLWRRLEKYPRVRRIADDAVQFADGSTITLQSFTVAVSRKRNPRKGKR